MEFGSAYQQHNVISNVVRFGSSSSSQASQNSGDICRICHCESDPQNPLLTPCYCSGSLKYVHQACLQQWLTASETSSCELCKFPFIMHTKIKPFNEWRGLEMSGVERRRFLCAVLFHCAAATCVIWSLCVLIERTAEEVKRGLIGWPFWTKLVVVTVGLTGGIVFMYIQCRQYFHLCTRWRAKNRILLIQNAPEKAAILHMLSESPTVVAPAGPPIVVANPSPIILHSGDRIIPSSGHGGQVVANIENNYRPSVDHEWSDILEDDDPCIGSFQYERPVSQRTMTAGMAAATQGWPQRITSGQAMFIENKDILNDERQSHGYMNHYQEQQQHQQLPQQSYNNQNHRHSTFIASPFRESEFAMRRYSDTRLHVLSPTNYSFIVGRLDRPMGAAEVPQTTDIIFETGSNHQSSDEVQIDQLELNIQELLELDIRTNAQKQWQVKAEEDAATVAVDITKTAKSRTSQVSVHSDPLWYNNEDANNRQRHTLGGGGGAGPRTSGNHPLLLHSLPNLLSVSSENLLPP